MIVGLTGGIGSGKSMVSRILSLMGCAVFSSDEAAKQVYFEEAVKKNVIALLGSDAYKSDCEIDRSYISSKIFSDTSLLQSLNGIIHPAVAQSFNAFVNTHPKAIIIKETALLFEAGIDKEVDMIVTVAADEEIRVERVMHRDGLSRNEVLKKIKSQLSQEEKIKKSHYVIYNNNNRSLIEQCAELIEKLKGPQHV
mgnify:CR=1 FL=1